MRKRPGGVRNGQRKIYCFGEVCRTSLPVTCLLYTNNCYTFELKLNLLGGISWLMHSPSSTSLAIYRRCKQNKASSLPSLHFYSHLPSTLCASLWIQSITVAPCAKQQAINNHKHFAFVAVPQPNNIIWLMFIPHHFPVLQAYSIGTYLYHSNVTSHSHPPSTAVMDFQDLSATTSVSAAGQLQRCSVRGGCSSADTAVVMQSGRVLP